MKIICMRNNSPFSSCSEQVATLMMRSTPCLFFLTGVRTEQDLYARLIDSVTKQVGRLSLNLPERIPIHPKELSLAFSTWNWIRPAGLYFLFPAHIVRGTEQEPRNVQSSAHAWGYVQVSDIQWLKFLPNGTKSKHPLFCYTLIFPALMKCAFGTLFFS